MTLLEETVELHEERVPRRGERALPQLEPSEAGPWGPHLAVREHAFFRDASGEDVGGVVTEKGLSRGQDCQGVPAHEWVVHLVRDLDGDLPPGDRRCHGARLQLHPRQIPEDQPSDVVVVHSDFLEGSLEQILHTWDVVPTHEGDGVHRLGASGAGLRLSEQLLAELAGGTRISSCEQGLRRPEVSQAEAVHLLGRGDRGCQPIELGGGEWSTPRHCTVARLLEGTGDLLARPRRTERQMPSLFLRILHRLRERSVSRASVVRRRDLVDRRREERVSELDRRAAHTDYPCDLGHGQTRGPSHDPFDERDRRVSGGSYEEGRDARGSRKRRHTAAQELAEAGGYR